MKLSLSPLALIFVICISVNLSAEVPTIKIGAIFGFTGPAHKYAEYARKGLDLAIAEVNQSGGIAGQTIEVFYEDSQTKPAQGVLAFNKLTEVQGVKIIVGDNWEFLTAPLITLADKKKVLLLSPTVMPHAITTKSDYHFTFSHSMESVHQATNKFLEMFKNDFQSAASICWDNAWGYGFRDTWQALAQQKGIKISATLCSIDFANDYRSEVTKIKQLKPDLVFAPYMAERIYRRMHEQGLNAKLLSTLNIREFLLDPKFDHQSLNGMYFIDWPVTEAFKQKYRTAYQSEPEFEANSAYDAGLAIAEALKINSKDLIAGMKAVDFEGASGRINFENRNHPRLLDAQLFVIKNGQAELVQ